MKLDVFNGQNVEELSMIEVAHAILEQRGEKMAFADLVNEIQRFLNKSDEVIREDLPQFYTDLNIDGSFISLGENVWALRSWYPYDSVDEEVNHPEDDDETTRDRKPKKVNAFLAAVEDEDIIDYDSDDPEDEELDVEDEDFDSEDLDDDDKSDTLPDGIEGKLADLDDDDEDE
ncbi:MULTISPECIES: DNA-directed RNA polymerase subunit delta [Holzapfeliella]|uniref:Probable DNA-directed RNA polymerase subunit delta n=1 Tax=Holzapfeliella saturejae TaxID=3082953 RepID=A0ABU8SF89_9LACO